MTTATGTSQSCIFNNKNKTSAQIARVKAYTQLVGFHNDQNTGDPLCRFSYRGDDVIGYHPMQFLFDLFRKASSTRRDGSATGGTASSVTMWYSRFLELSAWSFLFTVLTALTVSSVPLVIIFNCWLVCSAALQIDCFWSSQIVYSKKAFSYFLISGSKDQTVAQNLSRRDFVKSTVLGNHTQLSHGRTYTFACLLLPMVETIVFVNYLCVGFAIYIIFG